MAEFKFVMRQLRRMAEAGQHAEIRTADFLADDYDAEAAEKMAVEFYANHPESEYPSWKKWHDDNFPSGDRDRVCPKAYDNLWPCESRVDCGICLNKPIPIEIAKKLGIDK